MRIGLIIYGSLDLLSGGYLYDRMMVEYIRRQGARVEVISLPWRSYPKHLGDNFSDALLDQLAGLKIDLLLEDELNHPSLFLLNGRLKRQVSYPIVAIVHHLRSSEQRPAWQTRFYRGVERRYLRGADGFIFNSQTTRQVVEHVLRAGKSGEGIRPSVVAYPAGDRFDPQIDAVQIARRAHAPGPLRIVFLGNVIPRKGLHLLLEALIILAGQPWELQVIGSLGMDPRYARRMRRVTERSDIHGKVHFRGALDGGLLADELLASHVLVVPSSYEGFGIVYLEAMGFGLPAIAGSGGAAREIITPGCDGFLVGSGEASLLAERLSGLMHDRQQLASLGVAARQRYLSHPTWEQSGQRAWEFVRDFHA